MAAPLRVYYRLLRESDRCLLVDGMNRLSSRTRYLRFHEARNRLGASELDYLTRIDNRDHVAWLAFVREAGAAGTGRSKEEDRDRATLVPVGLGRYVRKAADRLGSVPLGAEAEIALVVCDNYQGQGIGRGLLRKLGQSALENGIDTFSGTFLADNAPARSLLGTFGAETARGDGGAIHFRMDVAGVLATEIEFHPNGAGARPAVRG